MQNVKDTKSEEHLAIERMRKALNAIDKALSERDAAKAALVQKEVALEQARAAYAACSQVRKPRKPRDVKVQEPRRKTPKEVAA